MLAHGLLTSLRAPCRLLGRPSGPSGVCHVSHQRSAKCPSGSATNHCPYFPVLSTHCNFLRHSRGPSSDPFWKPRLDTSAKSSFKSTTSRTSALHIATSAFHSATSAFHSATSAFHSATSALNSATSDSKKSAMKFKDDIKFIEIAANLTDDMFKGVYHGKTTHPPDIQAVLSRAWVAGVEKIIITGGNLEGSREALELARTDPRLYCTVGVHPTRCSEFEESGDPEKHLGKLLDLAKEGAAEGKVVAIGEFGLDYDRLQFCGMEVQKKYFAMQFRLAAATKLPLFLHMRAAAEDFLEIVKEHRSEFECGVVHSFTGTAEERDSILAESGLFIGINGCSLKTPQNLEVVKGIPVERMMLETDSPYCDIRSTHAGAQAIVSKWQAKKKEAYDAACMVKGRNEPCQLRQVLEVVTNTRGENDLSSFSATIYRNTSNMFFREG